MSRLISFDIDGTMIFGQPPGHVTLDMVRKAKQLGYTIGSASDRTIGNQKALWQTANIEVDFVTLKHHLPDIKERFGAASHYLHVGDTDMDRHFATVAGFDFLLIHDVPKDGSDGWLLKVPPKQVRLIKAAPLVIGSTEIAMVERPALFFVGIEVLASDDDIAAMLPTVWKWVYERQHQIPHRYGSTFSDLCLPAVRGMHRHLIGAEVTRVEAVPEEMVVMGIPRHRYLFRRYTGPRHGIVESFSEMYQWATDRKLLADGLKIDVGYLPDWEDTYHDLLVRIHLPEDSRVSQA